MLTMTTGTGAGGKVSVPRLVLTGTRHPGCSSEIQVEHSPRLDTIYHYLILKPSRLPTWET